MDSSLLVFTPKQDYFKLSDPKSLEKITRIFLTNEEKIKKPFNQLFNHNDELAKTLKIDLNLRPQNLNYETYYLIAKEFENLRN